MSDNFCKGCGKPCNTWGRTFVKLNGDYYHVGCLVEYAGALQKAARELLVMRPFMESINDKTLGMLARKLAAALEKAGKS